MVNPNSFRDENVSVEWPIANPTAERVVAVEATDVGFRVIEDPQALRSRCDFRVDLYREILTDAET
ncbi:hypothetical protein NW754_007795 [Fusarium falciforme]|nr:hypothetical protein NW754_007795 [Fusarium falciforme]